MTNRLLTSQDPEAIQLVNALGLEGHRVHSLKFELVAGNLALLTVESCVEEQGGRGLCGILPAVQPRTKGAF